MMKMEDKGRDVALLDTEIEETFNAHYLANLSGPPPFVRLESENCVN
jgi:hypothetical protein